VPCKEKPVAVVTKPTTVPEQKKPNPVDTSKNKPSDKNTGKTTANVNTAPPVNRDKPKPTSSEPVVSVPKSPQVLDSPNLDTIKSTTLSKGQTLRIRSIIFNVNDTTLNRSSYADLDKLNNFLKQNTNIIIEIGGHTNGLCDDAYCNSLSLRRARAVANYLIKNGTTAERLQMKGYGKTQPLSAVKSDPINQRVEIKILDL
jgi:outer membrane protein OmpA-like peptidoglycan-associated protein